MWIPLVQVDAYFLEVTVVLQAVGKDTQALAATLYDHTLILADVGEEVVCDGRETGNHRTPVQVPLEVQLGTGILLDDLCVSPRIVPSVEHVGLQGYPAIGHIHLVDVDESLEVVLYIVKYDGTAVREIVVEQAFALLLVGLVNGVELAPRLPRMDVAAVVAPAGGLVVECLVDGVIKAVPDLSHRLLAQQPAVGQQLLGATVVGFREQVVVQQVLEDAGGILPPVVLAEHVILHAEEDALGVPAEEAETLAVRAFAADGVPVVVVPVVVAVVMVDEHVVNEVVDVEQRFERVHLLAVLVQSLQAVVGRIVIGVCQFHLLGGLCHQLPCLKVALGGLNVVAAVFLDLYDVNVLLIATKMVFAVLVVHALGDVVQAPVHAVEEKVDIEGIDSRVADFALHPPCPDVTGVLRLLSVALTPVLPAVAKVAAQY